MSITTQEQNVLIKLVIAMLGIAPGPVYLPVVNKGFEDLGKHLPETAAALANLPQFQSMYPADLSATAFATRFLGSMGLPSDALAQRLVIELFEAGVPPAQIMLQAVLALDGSTAPAYASARALLDNKAEVAYYHALVLGRTDTDFAVLHKVLDSVTADPASVAVAKALLNPAPPAAEEPPAVSNDFTGTAADDSFVSTAAANRFDGGPSTSTSHNRVSYAPSTAAVTVDLNYTDGKGTFGGFAAGDKLVDIQDLTGSDFDDTFFASAAANYLDGGVSAAGAHNRVSYAASTSGVTVNLNFTNGTGTVGGYAAGDRLVNIQDLTGSAYDDTFVASAAANRFDGGVSTSSSHNRVSYAASDTGVTVDLNYTDGTGTLGGYSAGDTLVNIQDLTGSNFDDTFIASAAANNFFGLTGTNTVSYAASDTAVTLDLSSSIGTGTGGYAAGDSLVDIQSVIGSAFDDIFIAGQAAHAFDGGASSATSHNRVNYASSTAGVTVDLNFTDGTGTSGGFAAGDKLKNIQDLTGSSFDDTFVASAAGNRFDGGVSTSASHNRVSYASSDAGVTVNLNFTDGTGTTGGYATGDRLVNIQDVTGSAFDDVFIANTASNNFDGGAGSNTVSYAASAAGVTVNLSTSTGTGSGGSALQDTFLNIQNVIGTAFTDTLIGYATVGTKTVLTGGAGGDTLIGVAANRTYTYANYADSQSAVTIYLPRSDGFGTSGGDAAGDRLSFVNHLIGSNFDDTLFANAEVNRFDGGAGVDTVSYAASNAAVTVNLSVTDGTGNLGGYAAGDVLVNIENVIGSSYNDTLKGAAGGNSVIRGGVGADDLTGFGTGNVASYEGSSASVSINLITGLGTGGHAQGDVLHNIFSVIGSSFDDVFYASAAANAFVGGGGSDTVSYQFATGSSIEARLSTSVGTNGYAEGDSYSGITNLIGGESVASYLYGNGTGNVLTALGTSNTNVLSGGGAAAGQTDVFNAQLGGSNQIVAGAGSAIFNVSANGSDTIVNRSTGVANLLSINSSLATGTLHVEDLGATLTLSKFSSNVTGLTTLDISSGTNTQAVVSAADVRAMGIGNVLNIKLNANEGLQVSPADFYVLTGSDYIFYNDAAHSTEVARIHLVGV